MTMRKKLIFCILSIFILSIYILVGCQFSKNNIGDLEDIREREELSNLNTDVKIIEGYEPILYDAYIFYIGQDRNLWRMDKDGTNLKQLTTYTDKEILKFVIYNDKIYYNFSQTEDNLRNNKEITNIINFDGTYQEEVLWEYDNMRTDNILDAQIIFEDDSIYYLSNNALKRSNLKGTNREVLLFGLDYDFIIDKIIDIDVDYIYFASTKYLSSEGNDIRSKIYICKANKEGTKVEILEEFEKTIMSPFVGENFQVDNKWIYFYDEITKNLNKVEKHTGLVRNIAKITDVLQFSVSNDTIVIKGANGLYCTDIEGSYFKKLHDFCFDYTIYKDKLYYISLDNNREDYYIGQVDIKDYKELIIAQLNGKSISKIICANDWIYCSGLDGIFRVKIDGTGFEMIYEEIPLTSPKEVGDWVYFISNKGTLLYNPVMCRDSDLEKNKVDLEKMEIQDDSFLLEKLIYDFDNSWIEYVNNDITNIYNYIVPGSQVESYISSFSNTGVMEEFLAIEVKDAKVIDTDAYVKAYEKIKKTKNGKETIKEYNWIYHCKKVNGQWLVYNYVEDNSSSFSGINGELTEDWAEQNIDFKGYGTIEGGTRTDGIDIGKIRWSKQDGYERIVLDMHEFTYGDPGDVVDIVCYYEIVYYEGSNKSIISLFGARGIGGEIPDLSNSALISSIEKNYPPSDSEVEVIMKYKKPVELRIFELNNPGRIVIDIREVE